MSGVALLIEGRQFNNWVGLTLEFGRLAALLGTAGLSVQISRQNKRLGQLSRGVAVLAAVFTGGLITAATLTAAGFLSSSPLIVGLSTYVLSVTTFLLYGVVIIRTGSYSTFVGALLLVNVAALLVVFFGRLALPLGLLAAVIPGFQFLLYSVVGYRLRIDHSSTRQTAPVSDTTS
ncbi:MAG: hypothetical protein V5A55_06915 [Halovenus sp.]